jgi:hypothetical protein
MVYQIQIGDHGHARTLYLLLVHLGLFSVSCKANRTCTAPVWHVRRLRTSSRGSIFNSGMYTLHPRQPMPHLSMSSVRAHLPCSDPFTSCSCTQSLCYLSSHPTCCVTRQRAVRQCQTSALSSSRGGQRVTPKIYRASGAKGTIRSRGIHNGQERVQGDKERKSQAIYMGPAYFDSGLFSDHNDITICI